MRKYLIFFIVLVACAPTIAQTTFASIKLGDDKITDVKQFNLGDSIILVSYFEKNLNQHRCAIVAADGHYENLFVKDIPTQFCGVELKDGKWFLYFFERTSKKDLQLKTLFIDKKNGVRKILDGGIAISGQPIGVFDQGGISIFTWKKSEKKLSVYDVSEARYTENSYVLPENTDLLDPSDFQVVPPNPGWLYEVNAQAKIYFNDRQLKVTIDWANGTDVIYLTNPRRDFKIAMIPSEFAESGSFLCDSLLFRLVLDRPGLFINVFNVVDGSTMVSASLLKKDVQDSDKVYFHSGKDDVTHHKEKLKRMISSADFSAQPAIIARKIGEQDYCIILGSFFDRNGAGIVANPNPLVMLVSSLVLTAIRQARQTPAISRYLYSSFNGKAIDFKNEPSTVYKAIDDFDMLKRKGTTIEDVLVTDTKSAIIAIHDLKSGTLDLIGIQAK